MRCLALDIGDKRTGVAAGDTESETVDPLRTIEAPAKDLDNFLKRVERVVDDYAAELLVVGLPLNMDGSEGPRAKLVRSLAERLAERTGVPVHYQDERLTSAAADWDMAGSGLTHGQKKNRRDGLAAAAILRDYFAAQPRED